ncbi:hypothetical protein F0562_024562 [Nyssa sinensis]|uniref:Amino acid transporter transmembrane domain-containing protein n=1 Tax=Nyssa sinensis TaxID=561372 RepID=A0A5J5BCT4_9ASTE|nr:hypothetical protein F0562_024562 [Nyssa sinensis]
MLMSLMMILILIIYRLLLAIENTGSGIYGAVFNLTTSIIGAGIMALPATMKVLGVVLGLVLIVLMGILSEISVELLVRFSVQCKASSYGEVVQSALGRPARILSEICIIVNNAGVLVVYLIIMGDVLSGSMHHVGVFDQWLGNGMWDHRKLLILVIVVFFLAPLCALDKIDSLSLTSAASVALAVVFVLVAFVIAAIKLAEGKIEAPRMTPDFGSKKAILDLLVVIPIMSNAYVCHFNVQPIYNELEGRSTQKMNRVGRITTVLCVVVYASTAISCRASGIGGKRVVLLENWELLGQLISAANLFLLLIAVMDMSESSQISFDQVNEIEVLTREQADPKSASCVNQQGSSSKAKLVAHKARNLEITG